MARPHEARRLSIALDACVAGRRNRTGRGGVRDRADGSDAVFTGQPGRYPCVCATRAHLHWACQKGRISSPFTLKTGQSQWAECRYAVVAHAYPRPGVAVRLAAGVVATFSIPDVMPRSKAVTNLSPLPGLAWGLRPASARFDPHRPLGRCGMFRWKAARGAKPRPAAAPAQPRTASLSGAKPAKPAKQRQGYR